MTTDNRTNEKIVSEAVDSIHLSDWDEAQALCVKNVTRAVITGLDAAGRLKPTETKSSQDFVFSEAQVEAAAKAIADCHNPGMFEKYPENWRVEARAALVAAQGAAPVLPSSGVDEDALAEVRAMAWDEGALWAAVECGAIATENVAWLAPGENPYRAEAYRKDDR